MTLTECQLHDGLERVLIGDDELATRVRELGETIGAAYQEDEQPLLIGVLTGAFIFMGDLCRHMGVPLDVDFMAVSSYGQATVTSGEVKIISRSRDGMCSSSRTSSTVA